MKRIRLILLASVLPAFAQAQTIDLTTPGASYIAADGTRWYEGTTFPGGVAYTPFLRLQASSVEQGFNTDFRPLPPDMVGITTTRSITFGSLRPRILTDATGSNRLYTLFLDVNESTTTGDNYLSLDSLMVYSVPAASGGALSTMTAIQSAGTLRYDMDQPTNQVVLMDGNLIAGSGLADVEIDIPTSRFDGVGDGDFIYVYMHLGQVGTISTRKYGASAGFEELRTYATTTAVQESSSESARPWLRILGGPDFGSARFRYSVPGAGRTRLTLYDVHGRAVASTSSREEAGGVREISLQSLRNASRLASGIYFYEFQWNESLLKGKVAVLK